MNYHSRNANDSEQTRTTITDAYASKQTRELTHNANANASEQTRELA